jgi:hypothetical protein
MKTVVEVYVKSFSIPKDIESLHYAQQHTYCAPGMVERTLGLPGFSGRVLEPDSAELLSLLGAAQKQWGQRNQVIQVYDVGRLRGWLKAVMAGVCRTPTVAMGGDKYVGLPAAREMIRDLGTNNTK